LECAIVLKVPTFTLFLSAVAICLFATALPSVAAGGCSSANEKLGLCADIGSGQVDLESSRSSNGRTARPGNSDAPGTSPGRRPTAAEERRARERASGRSEFWVEYTPPPGAPGAPGAPAVTLSDIASFRPAVGSDHMEPNGWTVVGLETNFYSDAERHVVDGRLLGTPASVRFTPRTWHWDYGDGAVLDSSTPGASWASLGLPEFEPTATSHIYATAATSTIRLTIGFSAEYRVAGGSWAPIVGTLSIPAPPATTIASGAKTVLVARDCASNPAGPGC
jgi:hypothetical protein